MYPIEKYQFAIKPAKKDIFGGYISGPQVIAISSYAGQKVRGVAKCHANDIENFDEEYGKKLAALRCAEKIAEKRLNRAARKVIEAQNQFVGARDHLNNMYGYYDNAQTEYAEIMNELAKMGE